ncbi:MAG: 50S ribosomal protein L10 [Bacilli bacterium]|nr:50S ribosomal protein L10 [Bacilli bacterium]
MNQKTLESKKEIVESLRKQFQDAKSVAVVEYRGLTVSELSELRKSLKAVDAKFGVYKNTLVRIANDSLGHQELDEYLTGSNAYVFSSDTTGMPKVLAKFARTNDKLILKAGLVEGRFVDAKGLKEVAKLPSREGLISMFLSCLQAPIRSFACTVKAVADSKN